MVVEEPMHFLPSFTNVYYYTHTILQEERERKY